MPLTESPARSRSLDMLAPQRFGFRSFQHGWLYTSPGTGPVVFASLAWPHAQVPSFDEGLSGKEPTNALGLLVTLQQQVWGFPPNEAVPVNVLSILEDTGGAVLAAYDPALGFNADGWLGFAIGMGTRSGVLYSHMLGVRQDVRGTHRLGWLLKVLQGYLAVKSGHHAMTWTYDPLRGANARLNLEKLGATLINLTIDKYGVMRSSLYGDVPTDRFTAYWDLLDPVVHQRLAAVHARQFEPLTLDDIASVPEATIDSVNDLRRNEPTQLKYRIPGDIDILMRSDPVRAVAWRQEMRDVLGTLMTVRKAQYGQQAPMTDPIGVDAEIMSGPYVATGFASGWEPGEQSRTNFYLLQKGQQP